LVAGNEYEKSNVLNDEGIGVEMLDPDFLISVVAVTAGIYALFTLGLQLNVGHTGIMNFGQAGFMAVGAYTMGLLVLELRVAWYFAVPIAIAVTMLFSAVVGLAALRLRVEYLAIATLAASEVIRIVAQNMRSVTGGEKGLSCKEMRCFDDSWRSFEMSSLARLRDAGLDNPNPLLPLAITIWMTVVVATVALVWLRKSAWGRVLKAISEDEDAARAIGKNTFVYKIQSLMLSAALAAIAGLFLALNVGSIAPASFEPLFTFIGFVVLLVGGLGNYWAVPLASLVTWFVMDGSRQLSLPISSDNQAALRYIIIGLAIMLLMAFRPQGLFGNKQEMVLGE
jgi:branched-chain amino acid transport system permease protein